MRGNWNAQGRMWLQHQVELLSGMLILLWQGQAQLLWLNVHQECKRWQTTGFNSVSSVAQSSPTLCEPMDYSRLSCPSPIPGVYSNSCPLMVMPSNHLILCRPLLLPPSIFLSIRVFSNESILRIRWPKYWSFSFSISSSMNIQDWFPLGWTGWICLQAKGLSRVFSNTTVQKHQFFSSQLSL